MPHDTHHYDQEDVKVLYQVQQGRCACGAELFPSYHIRPRNPSVHPNHACNIVLQCSVCGSKRPAKRRGP